MKLPELKFNKPITGIVPEDKDLIAQPSHTLRWMLQQMLLIRAFEEKLLKLKEQNLINGPVHTSVGQEAVAVGAATAIIATDKITGTHRAHHQYLAKAINFYAGNDYDPLLSGISKEMHTEILILLQEIMGLAGGCCGGRGGSMHLYNEKLGVLGTNAIVGGGVPIAAGAAWAETFNGSKAVMLCFFGDGALYQGTIHESANLAAIWNTRIVYVIENNQYAVGTRRHDACSASRLCQVSVAYDMPGFQADGMDPLAVKMALEHILRDDNSLPCFLELDTYRHYHHAGGIPGSAFKYRDKSEEAAWRQRDPIETFRQRLQQAGILSDEDFSTLTHHANTTIEAIAAQCVSEIDGDGNLPAKRFAPVSSLSKGLRDNDVAALGNFTEQERMHCPRAIKYSNAIAETTGRWLEMDPTVVVLGEEVANLGGGAYGATKGLAKRYPDRVLNTPITEAGFCGLACGAAMNGMHPVVELMFSSFGLVAADQLFNQIGQLAHIYGGNVSIPLVVRTRMAAGLGYGAQHSMDPVALFALFSGWRIFVPTTPFDYIGMFNAAMKLKSPTLIVEHHGFYADTGPVPEGPPDHLIEPGRAKVLRSGKDVTVVTYGWMSRVGQEAAIRLEIEGITAEVIDLRTVDDAGLDVATIGASLEKTGILVVLEQAPSANSIGGKIISRCEKDYFDYFDGPPATLNAWEFPLPVSSLLEKACLPTVDDAVGLIRKAAKREI
ncbi:MAG: MFS transporter [Phycisphaerae bacterium]|nr:MFS transporter [Phycisphaerae bacterium]